jgi:hypothetical protein
MLNDNQNDAEEEIDNDNVDEISSKNTDKKINISISNYSSKSK